jgi:glutaredoxin 3
MDLAKQLVQSQIAKFPVVTFTKSFCPHSQKVKTLFTQNNIPFQDFQLDGRPDMDAIQDVLREITGGRTVPRVFVGGKFVGGGDDTVKLFNEGKLQPILKEASGA